MVRKRYAVLCGGLVAALLVGGGNAAAAPDTPPGRAVSVDLPSMRAAQVASAFTPVSPVRVLDTRIGHGAPVGPVGPGATLTIDLSSQVPDNATAVYLNVTGTEPTRTTFVSVFPAGTARSEASNLNLVPGQTRPNAVTVEVPPDRRVSLFNHVGSTHFVADLTGYYHTGQGSLFNPQTPQRVLDTRLGAGPVGPGGVVSVGFPGLPGGVTAVTFNLTGTEATASTHVIAYPSGTARPNTSSLNLVRGETAPNQVTVPVGADGRVNLFNHQGRTHLIVDVVGFYSNQGYFFFPLPPTRVLDTRPGGGLNTGWVLGLCDWGDDIQGLVLNVTGTNTTAPTFVTVWPADDPLPNASNLNLVPGQTAPNLVTVGLGVYPNPTPDFDCPGQSLLTFNHNGYVDLVYDLNGFFAL